MAKEDDIFWRLQPSFDHEIYTWFLQEQEGIPEDQRIQLSDAQMELVRLEKHIFNKLNADAGRSGSQQSSAAVSLLDLEQFMGPAQEE